MSTRVSTHSSGRGSHGGGGGSLQSPDHKCMYMYIAVRDAACNFRRLLYILLLYYCRSSRAGNVQHKNVAELHITTATAAVYVHHG